jgi:glycine cleavage system protein P-like pyridoxal-binding family
LVGNFLVYLRAYAYIINLGAEGLTQVSEYAVLNANYLMNKLNSNWEKLFFTLRWLNDNPEGTLLYNRHSVSP